MTSGGSTQRVNLESSPEAYTALDHAEELAWLDAHGQQVDQYAGRWIALAQHGIVAVADTLREVRAQASERGYPDPLLVSIPPHDTPHR